MNIDVEIKTAELPPRDRPGEWLEYSPLLTVIIVGLTLGWMIDEFTSKSWITAISGLNTYNLVFLMLGFVMLLWFVPGLATWLPAGVQG